MGEFKSLGGYVDQSRFKKRPRYSLVLHDVREKLDISLTTYVVIDSIHKLSSSDVRFPYCVMSKNDIADFLKISRRTVFRSIDEAENSGSSSAASMACGPPRNGSKPWRSTPSRPSDTPSAKLALTVPWVASYPHAAKLARRR